MVKLLGVRANITGIPDLLGAGVIKTLTDPILGRFVGDNTIISGIAKTVLATVISGRGGRIGNAATLAFGVGGGQDLAQGLLGMFGVGLGGIGAGGAGGRRVM